MAQNSPNQIMPVTENQAQRSGQVMSMLSGFANECLHELGFYPGMVQDMEKLRQGYNALSERLKTATGENRRLWQDNETLSHSLTATLGERDKLKSLLAAPPDSLQAACLNLKAENERLRKEYDQLHSNMRRLVNDGLKLGHMERVPSQTSTELILRFKPTTLPLLPPLESAPNAQQSRNSQINLPPTPTDNRPTQIVIPPGGEWTGVQRRKRSANAPAVYAKAPAAHSGRHNQSPIALRHSPANVPQQLSSQSRNAIAGPSHSRVQPTPLQRIPNHIAVSQPQHTTAMNSQQFQHSPSVSTNPTGNYANHPLSSSHNIHPPMQFRTAQANSYPSIRSTPVSRPISRQSSAAYPSPSSPHPPSDIHQHSPSWRNSEPLERQRVPQPLISHSQSLPPHNYPVPSENQVRSVFVQSSQLFDHQNHQQEPLANYVVPRLPSSEDDIEIIEKKVVLDGPAPPTPPQSNKSLSPENEARATCPSPIPLLVKSDSLKRGSFDMDGEWPGQEREESPKRMRFDEANPEPAAVNAAVTIIPITSGDGDPMSVSGAMQPQTEETSFVETPEVSGATSKQNAIEGPQDVESGASPENDDRGDNVQEESDEMLTPDEVFEDLLEHHEGSTKRCCLCRLMNGPDDDTLFESDVSADVLTTHFHSVHRNAWAKIWGLHILLDDHEESKKRCSVCPQNDSDTIFDLDVSEDILEYHFKTFHFALWQKLQKD